MKRSLVITFVMSSLLLAYTSMVKAQVTTPTANIYFEANTLTPAFYAGRAEPTVGSQVRAVAILSEGEPLNQYSYIWRVNQKVVPSTVSGGGNVISIPIAFSKEPVVSVSVYDKNNDLVATITELLELSEPFINFYEDNPLKGVSRLAANDGFIMTSDEATFRAEPYFMDQNLFSNQPKLEWSIDGQTTRSPDPDPQSITLLRTSAGGVSEVGLYLHNTSNLLQYTQNKFNVTF